MKQKLGVHDLDYRGGEGDTLALLPITSEPVPTF